MRSFGFFDSVLDFNVWQMQRVYSYPSRGFVGVLQSLLHGAHVNTHTQEHTCTQGKDREKKGVALSCLNIGLNSSTALNISLPLLQKWRRGGARGGKRKDWEREREREMSKWRGGLRGSGETEIRTIGIVKNRKKKEEQKRIRRGRKKEERLEARESNPSSSFLCKIRLKYFGISSDKWCITADKRKRVIFLCMRSRNLWIIPAWRNLVLISLCLTLWKILSFLSKINK